MKCKAEIDMRVGVDKEGIVRVRQRTFLTLPDGTVCISPVMSVRDKKAMDCWVLGAMEAFARSTGWTDPENSFTTA